MKLVSNLYVTMLGIGYFPIAQGTLGSIFTILIWFICLNYLSLVYFYLLLILVLISSFYLINIYLKNTAKDDPPEVIVDEFIGQSIPLLFIFNLSCIELLIAFSAFRVFDIFKIYPVNKAEQLKGSIGVIIDDIVAGIYALIILLLYKIFISI